MAGQEVANSLIVVGRHVVLVVRRPGIVGCHPHTVGAGFAPCKRVVNDACVVNILRPMTAVGRLLCTLSGAMFSVNPQMRCDVSLGTILLIILVLLLLGALPTWPYSSGWGFYPSSGLGLVLIVLLILVVTGRL